MSEKESEAISNIHIMPNTDSEIKDTIIEDKQIHNSPQEETQEYTNLRPSNMVSSNDMTNNNINTIMNSNMTDNQMNLTNNNVSDIVATEKPNNYGNTTKKEISKAPKENMSSKEILHELFAICIPTILFFFCLFIQQAINLSYVKKIKGINNKEAVAGIGIANLYLNVTLLSIAIGLLNGFNVLAGNAFGRKKFYLFGIYFHRCILISYLFAITIMIIHFFTIRYGLNLLGATGESLDYSESYAKISMFYVLFEILFNSSYRYLNMAKKGYITIIVLIITTGLHPLWCQLIMIDWDLKTEGAAICLLLSQFLTGGSLMLYIIIKKPIPNTVFCINVDSFKSWGPYLKIAIPGCLLLCLEWWAVELQQVIVAHCGREDAKDQLNTQVFSAVMFAVIISVSYGISISSAITSSKYVAINKIHELKQSTYYNLYFGIIVQGIVFVVMMIFRDSVFGIFTDDEKIIALGSDVVPYLMTAIFLNATKSSLQGVLTGLRKQIFASTISFISYYFIMLGLSFVFTLVMKMGVVGVWIAESIGYAVINIAYIIYILKIDLNKVVKETLVKIKEDQLALTKMNDIDEIESVYRKSTIDNRLIEDNDEDIEKKKHEIIHSANERETKFTM